MTDGVYAELALVEARAIRRWRRLQVPVGLGSGVLFAVMVHLSDETSGEHAGSWWAVPFVAIVYAAMYAGTQLWCRRKPGRRAVSLLLGVSAETRRQVRGDLR